MVEPGDYVRIRASWGQLYGYVREIRGDRVSVRIPGAYRLEVDLEQVHVASDPAKASA